MYCTNKVQQKQFVFPCLDYARSDLKERYGSTNGEEKDMPEKFSNILDEDVNYLSRKRKIKSRNQRRKIIGKFLHLIGISSYRPKLETIFSTVTDESGRGLL